MGRLMNAALLAAAIGAAEAAAPLQLAVSTDLTLVYADHGTGAGQDLSIWNATAPSGWSIVGHAGVSGYSSPDGLLVVRPGSDAAALARPTGLTLQWTNKMGGSTHGSMDGAFYTPVCPSGYGALGSVAIGALSATLADFPDLMCVKEAYLLPPQGSLKNLWKSTPTKFDKDGSVWAQTPAGGLPMPFVAGSPSSFAAPPAPHRLDVAKAQVVTMPLKIEQVHLALGHTVDTMAVSWATVSKQPAASAVVMWGTSPGSLTNKMEGNSRKFTQDPGRVWYSHVANMTGLTPATKYYYKVGDAKSGAWSKVFHFLGGDDRAAEARRAPAARHLRGHGGVARIFPLPRLRGCRLVHLHKHLARRGVGARGRHDPAPWRFCVRFQQRGWAQGRLLHAEH